jgi:hypothetical protein
VILHYFNLNTESPIKGGWIDFLRGTSLRENTENYMTKTYNYTPVCSIVNNTNYHLPNDYLNLIKQSVEQKTNEHFDYTNYKINEKQNQDYEQNN